jgi:hypothetical protein
MLVTYHTHPEVKSCGPDGEPCGRHTVGLLQRRPVEVLWVRAIGKESNRLEEVDAGIEHEWDEVRNVYPNPQQDWQEVLALLKKLPKRQVAELAWHQRADNSGYQEQAQEAGGQDSEGYRSCRCHPGPVAERPGGP